MCPRGVKVDLGPARLSQRAGPHECERGQSQRRPDDRRALVAVQHQEQGTDRLRVDDRWQMPLDRWGEGAAQVLGGIAGGAGARHGKPKDLPRDHLDALGGLDGAAAFNASQRRQEFGRADLRNRPAAEIGEEVALEHPLHLDPVVLGPRGLLLREPFERDATEAVRRARLLLSFVQLAQLRGIDAAAQLLASLRGRQACGPQRHRREDPERQQPLLAGEAVAEAPIAGAGDLTRR